VWQVWNSASRKWKVVSGVTVHAKTERLALCTRNTSAMTADDASVVASLTPDDASRIKPATLSSGAGAGRDRFNPMARDAESSEDGVEMGQTIRVSHDI